MSALRLDWLDCVDVEALYPSRRPKCQLRGLSNVRVGREDREPLLTEYLKRLQIGFPMHARKIERIVLVALREWIDAGENHPRRATCECQSRANDPV